MGALVEAFRSDIQAFRSNRGFLTADPAATARWAAWLRGEGEGPKVGLSWKSMKTSGHRAKHYAPFADWGAVLRPSEVVFVNLQYGDCAEERALAQTWGVKLMEPPDLDRTQNIEGAAALSAALDLVIGVGNASTNLAAALGVETWFLFPPVAWPKLGTDRHPWFPKTRGFAAARFGAWEAPLSTIAEALAAWRSARV
jgi:ADP-heptose:LPS heptosyltransferase